MRSAAVSRRRPLPERPPAAAVREPPAGTTVHELLAAATAELEHAGCESPRLDAELLLAEVLGCDRGGLVIAARDELEPGALASLRTLLARRAAREPVAYILGRREFRHLTLQVDPRVLIPRPETELLVEVGLTLPAGARVVDVGSGSGAVALALADERPDLEITATDVSPGALVVARANARRLELDVRFIETDLLEGTPGPFDAVLANLPYVARSEPLPPDVREYEPAGALFGGEHGLELIERLVAQLSGSIDGHAHGSEPALVALEHGAGQADAVVELLARAGYASQERLRDLAGHERVVVGRR